MPLFKSGKLDFNLDNQSSKNNKFILTSCVLLLIMFHFSRDYKVKYRSSEEGSKAEEFYVQNVSSEDQEVSAKLMVTCFQILSKFLIFSIVPESGSRHSLQDQYLRTGNWSSWKGNWIQRAPWKGNANRANLSSLKD